ncbi:hypothetical protein NL676_011150 [Syzygium grande]|nr:hypothetical protein NL676_011150 [Syzygium grande]
MAAPLKLEGWPWQPLELQAWLITKKRNTMTKIHFGQASSSSGRHGQASSSWPPNYKFEELKLNIKDGEMSRPWRCHSVLWLEAKLQARAAAMAKLRARAE